MAKLQEGVGKESQEILEPSDGKEMALAETVSWDSEDLGSVFTLAWSPSITVRETTSTFLSFPRPWCLRGISSSVHTSQ